MGILSTEEDGEDDEDHTDDHWDGGLGVHKDCKLCNQAKTTDSH